MTVRVDWRRVRDDESTIHSLAAAAASGKYLFLPTETGYGVYVDPKAEKKVERLVRQSTGDSKGALTLLFDDFVDRHRWIKLRGDDVERTVDRLSRGPILMMLDRSLIEPNASLAPPALRSLLADGPSFGIRVSQAEAVAAAASGSGGALLGIGYDAQRAGASSGFQASFDQAIEALGPVDDEWFAVDGGEPSLRAGETVVKINENGVAELVSAGAVTRELLNKFLAKTVLFVCSGNTCRSPMAEAICKRMLADRLRRTPDELAKSGYLILSAGASAREGSPASANAVRAVEAFKGTLEEHSSQPLTAGEASFADLIFCMTAAHRRSVLARWPSFESKTFTLIDGVDVDDPFGGSLSRYKECAAQIALGVKKRLNLIERIPSALENLS